MVVSVAESTRVNCPMATILGTHYVFMPLRVMTESCASSLRTKLKQQRSKRTMYYCELLFWNFFNLDILEGHLYVLPKSAIKMIQGSAVLIEKKTILLSLDTDRPNIVQLSYNFCLKIFTNLLARRVFCSTIEKIYLLILIRKYTQ